MLKLKTKEQVILFDEGCRYEGNYGRFYCFVILTTCQIIIIDTTNKHENKDIYCIKLKDILKDGNELALKNCNTDKTLFTENIMEIGHKAGKDKIIFRELDRHKQYITAIKQILDNL